VAKGSQAILVATDVAARGLDIPSVDSVIHFQMPRSAEIYVHRCGRTGRAQKTGISVAIVSPADRRDYLQICSATGKTDAGMEEFPVNLTMLKDVVIKRVKLAAEIAAFNVDNKRKKSQVDWFQKNASMVDVDLDDTFFPDLAEGVEEDLGKSNHVAKLKEELNRLLSRTNLLDPGVSRKFVAGDLDNLGAVISAQSRATIEKTFEKKTEASGAASTKKTTKKSKVHSIIDGKKKKK
jgi:ATP-dependent RNA helicase DDX24/MAK5